MDKNNLNSSVSVYLYKEYKFEQPGFYQVGSNGDLFTSTDKDQLSSKNADEAPAKVYLVINSKYYLVEKGYLFNINKETGEFTVYLNKNLNISPVNPVNPVNPVKPIIPEPPKPPVEEESYTWIWILIIILIIVIIVSIIIYLQCKKKISYN